ncbi:MAG: thiosulfate oxidation carrier complex protein SoxZ [Campylobacterota bacterium]
MARSRTRIKAKIRDGIVTVKAMARHEMLSYQEAENAGKEVNFITHLVAKAGGKTVYELSSSQFLSKNPYIKFQFKADAYGVKKGDEIETTWVDLKGDKDVGSSKIR